MLKYRRINIEKTLGIKKVSKTGQVMAAIQINPDKTAAQIVELLARKDIDTTLHSVRHSRQRLRNAGAELPVVKLQKDLVNLKIRKIVLENPELGGVSLDKILRNKRIRVSLARINHVRQVVRKEFRSKGEELPKAKMPPMKRKSRALTKKEAKYLPEGLRTLEIIAATTDPLIPWENKKEYIEEFKQYAAERLPLWIKSWLQHVPEEGKKKLVFSTYVSMRARYARREYAKDRMKQDLGITDGDSRILQRILKRLGEKKNIGQIAKELGLEKKRAENLMNTYHNYSRQYIFARPEGRRTKAPRFPSESR